MVIENGDKMRIESVRKIVHGLETKISKCRRELNKGMKVTKCSSIVSLSAAPITALISGVGIGIAAVPVAIIGSVLGVISITSVTTNKVFDSKIKKNNKKLLLTSETLSLFNEKLSESLEDSHISVEEYNELITMFNEYNVKLSKI